MAPPRVAAPLLLRQNLSSPPGSDAQLSNKHNAFTAFQCTSSSPNAKKIASKVSDSHSTNRYSNGVRQDAAAPTKDSNGHVSKNDSERTAHDSKTRERSRKSRVLLSESPTTPILSQEKQPRLGSLSSSTPLRRRVNAPSVNGPPLKQRRLLLSDDDDDADPVAAPQPHCPPPDGFEVTSVPETPTRGGPSVIDLTTPAKGSPPHHLGAPPDARSPTAANSLSNRSQTADCSPEKPPEETPMQKCEAIAARIRAALLDHTSGGSCSTNRSQEDAQHSSAAAEPTPTVDASMPAASESSGALQFVTGADVADACGPDSASGMLKPYQIVGLNWMLLLKRLGVGGCILADEMGLGKTASAICFMGLLKAVEHDPGPHMVVVPASLLENWRRELKRWCPSLTARTYHGPDRTEVSDEWDRWRRQEAEREDGSQAEAPPFDVLVTSYVYFERDSEDQKMDRKFFRRCMKHPTHPLSHIFLDEAHAIKAKAAQRTVRLRALARGCKRRIFLTGTPLQNDLEELQSLLSFLLPDVFGEGMDFHTRGEDNAQDEDETAAAATRMRSLLEPFLLRRLKTHVATQLVAKSQQMRSVTMTAPQKQLYEATVESFRKTAAPPGGKAPTKKTLKALATKNASNIFVQLRKVAQHPLLLRSLFSDETITTMSTICRRRGDFGVDASQQQVEEELSGWSDYALHHLCVTSTDRKLQGLQLESSVMLTSAKFQLLAKLLPELQGAGSRPLIFSQWTSVLDLLEWLMQDLGLSFVRLDGSTAVAERLSIVDSFNRDTSIFAFLLSTRAGGQGLNLVGADTVILHDVDFNPQIDRQAEDRSHRLGQERPVTIYRLVTRDTVDQKINDIAQRKLKLDAAVLTGLGVTASTKASGAAAERQAMSSILEEILQEKQLSCGTCSDKS